jgi:hypothetical protein
MKWSVLLLRGTTYYSKISVPLDCQPILGRRELWKSLRTSNLEEAKLLSLRVTGEARRMFGGDDLVVSEGDVERCHAQELSGEAANLHRALDLAAMLGLTGQELKDVADGLPVLQEEEQDEGCCERRGRENRLQVFETDLPAFHDRECTLRTSGRRLRRNLPEWHAPLRVEQRAPANGAIAFFESSELVGLEVSCSQRRRGRGRPRARYG